MKNLFFLLLLSPLFAFAQGDTDYLIFEISTIKVNPANIGQVESGMATHNKKYHGSGPNGTRVYQVANGKDGGAYKWVMGPAPWSALDTRPSDEAHDLDWQANVNQYTLADGNTEYIRFDAKLSRFPKDFTVNKLWVQYVDIARGKMDKAKEIIGKIHKVYAEKIQGDTYGIYWNELPSSSSGRDMTIVAFFDKFAWMSADNGFDAKFEEVYGKGSLETMWNEWRDITEGVETEIWEYREDLSGLSGMLKVAERQ
jgi:hypothetical protein